MCQCQVWQQCTSAVIESAESGCHFFLVCKATSVCLSADPDLLKQLFTKSFMKFHDRPDMQMRLAEGDEITTEGMLAAKCAHLPMHIMVHSDCSEVIRKVFCLTRSYSTTVTCLAIRWPI